MTYTERQSQLNKLRAIFARCANTTSSGEAATAAKMARAWMRKYGFTQSDVKGEWWDFRSVSERENVENNFRTVQAHWRALDREERAKAESTEPGYRLVTVAGHWRVSKLGKCFWVSEHTRKIRVKG